MRPEDLLARLEAGYEYDPMYGRLCNERDQLKAENDKLRELVRDMFGAYKGTVEMLPSSYSKNVAEMAVMDISDRMRELGVDA